MSVYTTHTGKHVITSAELGKGGEGIVYAIGGDFEQVAKIYHLAQRTPEKENKLKAMIANPPQDDTRQHTPPHISITWPTELLYDNRQFAGYLMPRISQSPNIFEFYNPTIRTAKDLAGFNWQYLHRAARNFAAILNILHVRGYVMGDINQKNVMVTRSTLVTLVDTDSFQVQDTSGHIYRCPVGVPEYTPPELQGIHLASIDRTPSNDCFGLAVIIFQLLMEGVHPFAGTPKDPTLSVYGAAYLHCIKQGIFPYQPNNNFKPPPIAPPFNTLHPEIQNLFIRCFVNGHENPSQRPKPDEWISALNHAENNLVKCKRDPSHWYSKHAGGCHWCERERKALPTQQALAPIGSQKKEFVKMLPAPFFELLRQLPGWFIASIALVGIVLSGWLAFSSFGLSPSEASIPTLPTMQLITPSPMPVVPTGQIVFSRIKDGQQILNVVNADGTNERSLNVAGWSPLWSPDARQIAFISDRGAGVQQVYLVKSEGGSLTRLTNMEGEKSALFWSKSGDFLMFVATQEQKSRVYRVDVLGLKVEAVTEEQSGEIKQITWSPDKKQLLFNVQSGDDSRVYRFDIDSKQAWPLTNFNSWQPTWSPDGKEIAVASQDGIYKMDENGQKRLRLTTFLSGSPAWSVDARYIAFISDKGLKEQVPELWFMEADGSNMKRLTTTGCWRYVWAKENLIYITGDNISQPASLQIWVFNLPTGQRTKLAELNQPDISWIP